MSSSTSEEKKNPVVTLKAQAEKFDFSKLRAGKNNTGANSGYQTYLDIKRMNFVINEKSIDSALTTALIKGAEQNELEKSWSGHCKEEKTPDHKKTDQYKKKFEEFYNLGTKYTNLLPKEKAGNYRPFAKQVFKEMFKYAKAEIPSDSILEELITNCSQAGYDGSLHMQFHNILFNEYGLGLAHPSEKKISINCDDPRLVNIICNSLIPVENFYNPEEKICELDGLLGFILESQDGKDGVTYKNGKLSLTIPEELRDYPVINEMQQSKSKSLFDVIKEIFFQLIEKVFGHTNDIKIIEENDEIKMTVSFGKSLKVKSTLKEVKPIIDDIKATRGK